MDSPISITFALFNRSQDSVMKKRKKRDLDEDSEYSEDERGTAMELYNKIKPLDDFFCCCCSTRIGHHYHFSNPFQSKT